MPLGSLLYLWFYEGRRHFEFNEGKIKVEGELPTIQLLYFTGNSKAGRVLLHIDRSTSDFIEPKDEKLKSLCEFSGTTKGFGFIGTTYI
ncbi:hypothetical protein CDL12_21439 [Handroanthus impetiginosus]|uniref:Uncharacterized protein n=1 Tax=Handroanthus impetiginosus TaxID=429701 RepID=A0A2G9GL81_9LAMI|nr:hypothetical protein CDL12_21439 [Handroanthus impetiginosus]